MARYCLSYNQTSTRMPDHVPGDPAHADGGKLIEFRADQLAVARHAFPPNDHHLSVIEMPPGDHETINVAEWDPKLWQRCQDKWGQPVKQDHP